MTPKTWRKIRHTRKKKEKKRDRETVFHDDDGDDDEDDDDDDNNHNNNNNVLIYVPFLQIEAHIARCKANNESTVKTELLAQSFDVH